MACYANNRLNHTPFGCIGWQSGFLRDCMLGTNGGWMIVPHKASNGESVFVRCCDGCSLDIRHDHMSEVIF